MKSVLCVLVFGLLALGARAQMGEPEPAPEPLGPAEYTQKILELEQLVNKLKFGLNKYTRIGKGNIGVLQNVMNRVDKQRYKCLVLETLRPAPVPLEPLPPVPLKPVENPLNIRQISQKIRQLGAKLEKIKTGAMRYVSIGKNNIGIMHRFAEASRNAVCGADHYSKCPMGFIYNANSDSCFRELVGRFKTFAQAQAKCHQRGAHLPRIASLAENNAIAGLLQLAVTATNPSENTHAVYIGLQRTAENVWQWVHPEDSPVDLNAEGSFVLFASEGEDENKACAYLCTMSNKWVKTSCDTRARVICERPKNPPPQVEQD